VRAEANIRLREEAARAREEANTRLETEVAAIKADAEQRRSNELEEVRAQVLRLRTAAAEQARVAAEQAVAVEVARAKSLTPIAPSVKDLEHQWAETFVADERRPTTRSFQPVPSRRRTWIIAASVMLVALVGSVFAFGVIPFGKSPRKATASVVNKEQAPEPAAPWVDDKDRTAPAVGPGGELQVESTPAGARVLLDGRESGFTPVTLKDVSAGKHALVLEGATGTVRRTVRIQSGERTVANYEITAGFLSVISRIPVDVYQGSRKIGASGEGHILLAPGQYKLSLVNSHFHFSSEVEFTIRPGEVTTHTVELPMGSIVVNTAPGAEILVEGEKVGTSPMGPIPAPIGTRDVTVRHPQMGERHQSVEVLGDRPSEVSVAFDGAPASRTPPRLAPLSMTPPATRSR
jgi:hypothetical protein